MTETVYSPKMQTFDFTKERDLLDIGTEWEILAELKPPRREHGAYRFDLDMMYSYDRTTSSADFGFSTDGGVTWFDIHQEAQDISDITPLNYGFPFKLTHSYPHFLFRGRKEAGQGQLDILFLDMSLERKG